MASEKVIVCVHGAGPKPTEPELRKYWQEAIAQGLGRTLPAAVAAFDRAQFDLLYWAGASNTPYPDYDLALDMQQRQLVLTQLAELSKNRDFRRRHYDELPGKTTLKEFAMDTLATLGLGGLIWPRVMPELAAYWRDENSWAADTRNSLATLLEAHINAGRDVWLISHCMGAVISYDTLCELDLAQRLTGWLTLGAPLSANAVRNKLWGMSEPTTYPTNLLAWHNFSAEDDYVCHDKTVANDFSAMLDRRLIGDIRDHTIYNLAVRYGRSNPHHSAGYLVHPRTAELLGKWLTETEK